MSDMQPSPVTSDRDADAMEEALRRAAQSKPAEPDIAADDEGATAAAEETQEETAGGRRPGTGGA